MPLQIANTTRRTIDERRLGHAVLTVFREEGRPAGSVDAVYCGSRMIRRINREFLQHDYATDTITFRYDEGGEIEGEFYICLDVIAGNARRFGTTFDDELMRVTIHSALHLVGYDDGSPKERAEMTRLEDLYLGKVRGSLDKRSIRRNTW
ncbi:MAG: rRNA maturation RNase YbeY [Chlorobiaceae bacterium]|nr:rRNA maturation RNase YbeY [Chlorobiaceae bacterium]